MNLQLRRNAKLGASSQIDARMVQLRATTAASPLPHDPHEIAARGVSGSGRRMPHADAIIASFGEQHRPAIEGIQAHVGGEAARAAGVIGAEAYTTGSRVAFASAPNLGLAAHEATHVVQLHARPSLVDRMRQMAAAHPGGPTILGGNASFPEGPDFLDAHGNFDINWSGPTRR